MSTPITPELEQELADGNYVSNERYVATLQGHMQDIRLLNQKVEALTAERDALTQENSTYFQRMHKVLADRDVLKTDAKRFRSAIALEDNADYLCAAVRNNAPDEAAIRAEFDDAIEKAS